MFWASSVLCNCTWSRKGLHERTYSKSYGHHSQLRCLSEGKCSPHLHGRYRLSAMPLCFSMKSLKQKQTQWIKTASYSQCNYLSSLLFGFSGVSRCPCCVHWCFHVLNFSHWATITWRSPQEERTQGWREDRDVEDECTRPAQWSLLYTSSPSASWTKATKGSQDHLNPWRLSRPHLESSFPCLPSLSPLFCSSIKVHSALLQSWWACFPRSESPSYFSDFQVLAGPLRLPNWQGFLGITTQTSPGPSRRVLGSPHCYLSNPSNSSDGCKLWEQ